MRHFNWGLTFCPTIGQLFSSSKCQSEISPCTGIKIKSSSLFFSSHQKVGKIKILNVGNMKVNSHAVIGSLKASSHRRQISRNDERGMENERNPVCLLVLGPNMSTPAQQIS